MIDLTEPAKVGPGFVDGQPHVIFGRVEELDPIFGFMHDADDLIDYPFAHIRWIEYEDGVDDVAVTLLSENEVKALAIWATKMSHEQFELNRGHSE